MVVPSDFRRVSQLLRQRVCAGVGQRTEHIAGKRNGSEPGRTESNMPMNRNTVAIFGSTGQLGNDLVEVLRESGGFDVIPFAHEDADCADLDAVRKVLLGARPQMVINIARDCGEIGSLCVYLSTDYVFDGTKETPYVESDPTCPINVYGASKLAGEHLTRQAAPRWLIVRVASLFGKTGARGKGGNFIETILNKAKQGEAIK